MDTETGNTIGYRYRYQYQHWELYRYYYWVLLPIPRLNTLVLLLLLKYVLTPQHWYQLYVYVHDSGVLNLCLDFTETCSLKSLIKVLLHSGEVLFTHWHLHWGHTLFSVQPIRFGHGVRTEIFHGPQFSPLMRRPCHNETSRPPTVTD